MSGVDLIHVSRLFFESNLLGIEGTNDSKFLEKNHRSLEMKNKGEKTEIFWARTGAMHLPECHKVILNIGLWCVAPAIVPQKVF